jgi:hypothetical protein
MTHFEGIPALAEEQPKERALGTGLQHHKG